MLLLWCLFRQGVDVARRCGKEAEALQFEWGVPVDPAAIDAKLATGEFDLVTFIHNETSTGVMNPLAEVAAVVRKYDDGPPRHRHRLELHRRADRGRQARIDVLLTGSQKALALPPGLALFSASERAMAKAATIHDRGYYFDFLEFQANHENSMTPSTPCIATIYGLNHQLDVIFAEGIENRFARHEKLNNLVHAWVKKNGFEFFAPEGLSLEVAHLHQEQQGDRRRQTRLDHAQGALPRHRRGYGKIKGKTFRLSNMGDETEATIQNLLDALDDALTKL